MSEPAIVVVGGGHAAGQLLVSLRKTGYPGPVTLIGDEPDLPYQRPPLSKAYLAGELERERVLFRPEKFYADNAIDARLGQRVTAIDRDERRVTSASGMHVEFDKLALTTGGRVRKLEVPGAELSGVHYLRTLADVDAIAAQLEAVEQLVVIGGGFIGLEVSAVARKLGKRVTVIEMQDRLMPRVVSPTLSAFYLDYHRQQGVEIVTGARVSAIVGDQDRAVAVECGDGARYPGELIVVGIGIVPNSELAEQAGLACDNGIVVDEFARTSDPAIVAAGDCTRHPNSLLGRSLRLESVHNAVEQAKTAAATLCGQELPYAQIPWFWSDQYDLKLQMVGQSTGYDREVLRGSADPSGFSIFYFKEGKLIAIDSVNRPIDHMLGRKLLTAGAAVTPEQAADPAFDLKSLLT